MSARLKLKKLQKEIKFIRDISRTREYELMHEMHKCSKLLKENIIEIRAYAELYPSDTMQCAVKQLDYSVYKVTDAIVGEYAKQFAKYVRDELTTKYLLSAFSEFYVTLFAPALNKEHIKVEIRKRHK